MFLLSPASSPFLSQFSDAELTKLLYLQKESLALLEKEISFREQEAQKKSLDKTSFYVYNTDHRLYTVIVADNIHHAGNKATKLFKDKYQSISIFPDTSGAYNLLSVAEFNKAVGNKRI